jgi:hypothetical protein
MFIKVRFNKVKNILILPEMIAYLKIKLLLIFLWFVSYGDTAIYGTPLVFYSRNYESKHRTLSVGHSNHRHVQDICHHNSNRSIKYRSNRNSSFGIFKASGPIQFICFRSHCKWKHKFKLHDNRQPDTSDKRDENELLFDCH